MKEFFDSAELVINANLNNMMQDVKDLRHKAVLAAKNNPKGNPELTDFINKMREVHRTLSSIYQIPLVKTSRKLNKYKVSGDLRDHN